MPTTLRLFLLLMLGLFGLQPVGYAYDAPVAFVSGAQNIVAASSETGAPTGESAASAPLNFSRGGAATDIQADTHAFSSFVAAESVTTPIGELRAAGLKDAHHVIQDAAVRDIPGYNTNLAPGVQLEGPSTAVGSPHYLATQVQRAAGGGTYAAEREIAASSLRAAGYSEAQIQQALVEADAHFQSLGVTPSTPTRIPGNRP